MAEVNKINLRIVPVTLELAGETVTLNVKRRPVSFEAWRVLAKRHDDFKAQSDDDEAPPVNTFPLIQDLCQLVVDLDLTVEGAPLPVTAEKLAELDVRLLSEIHAAVLGDANPNPKQP